MSPVVCRQCLYQQVVQGIASARRLPPAEVEAAINASPLLASQAVQLKLVDGLAYRWGCARPYLGCGKVCTLTLCMVSALFVTL